MVPTNPDMGFFAIDVTRPGSLGASANASGRSEIGVLDDRMGIMVRLDVAYVPSLFGGGDNPGSMAEGSLSSVIEFVLPADELIWAYQLDIRETIRFKGSTSVLFENVTQSEVLLDATAAIFPPIETTLSGNTGDLMRVTTMMSGSGSTKPSSKNQYTPTLDMVFIIPEPATLSLLALGGYLASRPRRRGSLQSS